MGLLAEFILHEIRLRDARSGGAVRLHRGEDSGDDRGSDHAIQGNSGISETATNQ